MKLNKKIIVLLIVLLFLAVGSVSAANDTNTSKEISINDNNYDTYFDSDGKLKDSTDFVEGDTLYINGSLTNKKLKLDKKTVIDGKNTGKIINSTIVLGADASGSTLKGLTFDITDKNAINLTNGASYINIHNNIINIRGTDALSGYDSLYGIFATGETSYNNITNNNITMSGKAPYNYAISVGIDWMSPNPNNYLIANNRINADVDNYIAGIQSESLVNATIRNNNINLNSKGLVYGIIITDMFLYDFNVGDWEIRNLIPSRGINIIENTINGNGNIVYLIELYQVGNQEYYYESAENVEDYDGPVTTVIENNILSGKGTSIYGIAAIASKYINITGNNINVLGGNYSSITNNSDIIGVGNNPIALWGDSNGVSQYINITNNKFQTNNGVIIGYTFDNPNLAPKNVTYLDNLQTFVIDDDSYSNFFDENGNFLAYINVTATDSVRLGNLSRKKLIIDRKLNISSFDENSKFSFSQLIIDGEDASGTTIKGLNALSNSSIFIIRGSHDTIIENNIINITSNSVEGAYETINAVSIESNNNKLINNNIIIQGIHPSGWYYGISISGENNLISGNNIKITSNNCAEGLYLTHVINNTVSNNTINLIAKNFAYGILVGDSYSASFGNISENNRILNNKINAKASMIYLLRSDFAINTTFKNNTLYGEGDAVYGYAGTSSQNDTIEGNTITISGIDVNKTPENYDTAGSGHAGIFTKDSFSLTIKNNKIISTYKKGGDYGIRIINSTQGSKNIIENNYISSDNGKKLGTKAISTDGSSDVIARNTPIGTSISITTKTIYKGKNAVITATLKDANGKLLANKKVTLTINGKKYSKNTNSKGVATFTISSLNVGKTTAKIAYSGSTEFASSSNSAIQTVKGIADLVIKKVKKSRNVYKIIITNKGSAKSTATKLKVYYKKNKYKIVKVKRISAGKSLTVKVRFFKNLANKKYTKVAYVNYNKKALESSYKNNKKAFKI
ncbi:bacterial Ig-like domain protein [Methanobrevibacter cuticularis]|uniref:Bacterial Ig-like domain protein n=1 Tax=Methanobrevibacter cuticularis TaxID=47311 RepID=A0A166DLH6_9EURY|nr:Ig-like domain repeat protein [Methanobrevibacter cuticularis]KZX15723.1 bacterial Ig-like domain protein [Methanobrevibacter cuticularis]